jgi:hypothetical protein
MHSALTTAGTTTDAPRPSPPGTAELARLRYPAVRSDAWRERLTPEARRLVERIQHDDLRRLGHPL